MTDSSLIYRAFKLCCEAHDGQYDRDGKLHVFHAVRVAEKQTTDDRIAIALLHDVIEDAPKFRSRLKEEFPEKIFLAVKALSRGPTETWSSYMKRVCDSRDAMWVKKADIEDNTSIVRMDLKAAKRMTMYKEAHAMICNKLLGF